MAITYRAAARAPLGGGTSRPAPVPWSLPLTLQPVNSARSGCARCCSVVLRWRVVRSGGALMAGASSAAAGGPGPGRRVRGDGRRGGVAGGRCGRFGGGATGGRCWVRGSGRVRSGWCGVGCECAVVVRAAAPVYRGLPQPGWAAGGGSRVRCGLGRRRPGWCGARRVGRPDGGRRGAAQWAAARAREAVAVSVWETLPYTRAEVRSFVAGIEQLRAGIMAALASRAPARRGPGRRPAGGPAAMSRRGGRAASAPGGGREPAPRAGVGRVGGAGGCLGRWWGGRPDGRLGRP
jgi:hypothetical protein